jgi:hypothetical protein
MVEAVAANGWIDRDRAILETLTRVPRGGHGAQVRGRRGRAAPRVAAAGERGPWAPPSDPFFSGFPRALSHPGPRITAYVQLPLRVGELHENASTGGA